MNQFHTAESVTEGHPDKLCDLIADSVLDECLSHDALFRVACEVLATRGQIIVAGEITSLFEPQIPAIAHSVLQKVGYDPARYAIQCLVHKQSPPPHQRPHRSPENRGYPRIKTGWKSAGHRGV